MRQVKKQKNTGITCVYKNWDGS